MFRSSSCNRKDDDRGGNQSAELADEGFQIRSSRCSTVVRKDDQGRSRNRAISDHVVDTDLVQVTREQCDWLVVLEQTYDGTQGVAVYPALETVCVVDPPPSQILPRPNNLYVDGALIETARVISD